MHVKHGALAATLAALQPGQRALLWFSGSEDSHGRSWCPDCVSAKAPVNAALQRHAAALAATTTVVHVDVGERSEWKSASHPLRSGRYALTGVPTLLEAAQPRQRLVESQLLNAANLDLFLVGGATD